MCAEEEGGGVSVRARACKGREPIQCALIQRFGARPAPPLVEKRGRKKGRAGEEEEGRREEEEVLQCTLIQ